MKILSPRVIIEHLTHAFTWRHFSLPTFLSTESQEVGERDAIYNLNIWGVGNEKGGNEEIFLSDFISWIILTSISYVLFKMSKLVQKFFKANLSWKLIKCV